MSQEDRIPGGGSGGGCDKHHESHHYDGTYTLEANQFEFKARSAIPPATPDPCVVTIISQNTLDPTQGQVNIRGQSGVRVTSGPIPVPATDSTSSNGFEVEVADSQKVIIKRGIIPIIDQQVQITSDGILIDGGAQPVKVKSLTNIELSVLGGLSKITIGMTSIKLSVMGGLSSIELGPLGITISGLPFVKIN